MCHQLKIKCELVFARRAQPFATVHVGYASQGSSEIHHIPHRSWELGWRFIRRLLIWLRKTPLVWPKKNKWVKKGNSNDTCPSCHFQLNHSWSFTSSDPGFNVCCHHRLCPGFIKSVSSTNVVSGVTAQTGGLCLTLHLLFSSQWDNQCNNLFTVAFRVLHPQLIGLFFVLICSFNFFIWTIFLA